MAYQIILVGNRYSIFNKNVVMKANFNSHTAAVSYRNRLMKDSPMGVVEVELSKLLTRNGHDARFRQRGDFGIGSYSIRVDEWSGVDDKVLREMIEIEPNLSEQRLFDDKHGWSYHYQVLKSK